MFGKMVNNYYYGKSGKGDFRKEDLPKNRWQLFWSMLRIRLSGLVKLNLMTAVCFLPIILLIANSVFMFMNAIGLNGELLMIVKEAGIIDNSGKILDETMTPEQYRADVTEVLLKAERTQDEVNFFLDFKLNDFMRTLLLRLTVFLVPCIAITGPCQAGMAYVTRNWARDEHSFVWSDFKDAVRDNWKQALATSVITSLFPLVVYVCWIFYGDLARTQGAFFAVPQVLVAVIAVVWCLGLVYLYPMMVSYKAKYRVILKNSLIMGIARLPHTVLSRLALLIPSAVVVLMLLSTGYGMMALLVLFCYYILFGNAFARFVFASLSNAAFDKFINCHMEGVQVDRGLNLEDDDDDEEEEPSLLSDSSDSADSSSDSALPPQN